MSTVPAIGIDLGTTFSVAAVHRNGKTEVIADIEGERLIPSCVLYKPNTLDVLVGSSADQLGVKAIKNFLLDIKRLIGRKFADAYVKKVKDNYRFQIVSGEDNNAEIRLMHDNVIVSKSPEQVSSEILKYLREQASNYLGADVREAVISVPARFSNAQRKATRAAAELAGLNVLKLITEPVAAAIHYCEDKLQTKGHLLVFDLGGGTLDISIINIEKKTFSVKSVEGDTFLGGRDFDEVLLNYTKQQIAKKYEFSSFSDVDLFRLQRMVIKAKCKLSTLTEYVIDIPMLGGSREIDGEISITRSHFESITFDLVARCRGALEKCIKEAGLSKTDISEILLVGGSTRIPIIRKTIKNFFQKEPKTDVNPDEAVAIGAAIQAAVLKKEFREYEKYQITEVTPLSLGSAVNGDLFDIKIKKNTPLPFKSKPISLVTVHNDQKIVLFKIYEGDRKRCKYNNFLGSFTIGGLPLGRAGDVKFEMTFALNKDGILEVEAWETSTRNKNTLVVTMGGYGLCEYKVNNTIEDALKNKKEDDAFEISNRYMVFVKKKCQHIIYDLKQIESETERDFVRQKCSSFLRRIEIIENIEDLRAEYKNFRTSVYSIVSLSNIDVQLKCDEDILYKIVLDAIKESDLQFYPPQLSTVVRGRKKPIRQYRTKRNTRQNS